MNPTAPSLLTAFSPADFLLAEWARTQRSGPTATTNSLRNTAAPGYDHLLSKRTDIYAIYSLDKLSCHPIGNTFAVGIRHTPEMCSFPESSKGFPHH